MLTCISCSKQLPAGAAPLRDLPEDDEDDNAVAGIGGDSVATPSTSTQGKLSRRSPPRWVTLGLRIKDMALKASGAYRHCKPCAGSSAAASRRHHRYHHGGAFADSDVASGSERFPPTTRTAPVRAAPRRRLPVGLASTPKLSNISGAKTETSSVDASVRTSSSPEEVDRCSELSVSVSNASDQEREWIEEDEPGVYITIRALPGGIRELRRVRFSWVGGSVLKNIEILDRVYQPEFAVLEKQKLPHDIAVADLEIPRNIVADEEAMMLRTVPGLDRVNPGDSLDQCRLVSVGCSFPVLKNPVIYLLDEATNALDSESRTDQSHLNQVPDRIARGVEDKNKKRTGRGGLPACVPDVSSGNTSRVGRASPSRVASLRQQQHNLPPC
ncbi:hypothetical protein PR202_gb29761 [Eleusine coracana subsp. coracana]|uniref:BRX domain-containing protein n=1 Tax=Eleusine coracana subsp. coracana TaxID=191504 RepID=A0AAV5G2N8_ELECO|nr:hypothetical protein PR202_gb29761 [Eleusine coracana subsp. coracana]